MMTDKAGIYIHVPFCLSKCHYCDFCSRTRADDETKKLYVTRLCEEIRVFGSELEGRPVADTVYFGGGTPTLLSSEQLSRILDTVNEVFGIDQGAEITAETNPKSADLLKLRDMRSIGINRLSIGMQSVHDNELKALGRIHRFSDFADTYLDARQAGFNNVSVDLMYGIPEQNIESFRRSVETLAVAHPEHISSYCLTVEDGTHFGNRRDSLVLPDEDAVSEMYIMMTEMLRAYGYEKYEISNFAHNGQVSRHNLKYWKREDYLGFGPAAHSFFGGVRFANSRDVEGYLNGKDIKEHSEKITDRDAADEYVMLGMRLREGIDIGEFNRIFDVDFMERYGNTFERFAPEYISIDDRRCAFTDKGMFVSNYILSET
ncbi:MAG: radical SAM family heme chaperone HemW [Clostridia bacterium]|nr:radical SAM family heme chaperone HemW [Clostridia bacterium]